MECLIVVTEISYLPETSFCRQDQLYETNFLDPPFRLFAPESLSGVVSASRVTSLDLEQGCHSLQKGSASFLSKFIGSSDRCGILHSSSRPERNAEV